MSLINDALKRAKQAQPQSPPPPAQFRPVESEQVRSGLPLLPLAVIVVLLVAGGVFIGLALSRREAPRQVAARAQDSVPVSKQMPQSRPVADHAPAASATARVQNPGVAQPAPLETASPVKAQPASNSLPDAVQVPQGAVEISPPKPAVPTLRGIYYNPTRPSAVLNTKTVFVGDSVSGFQVLEIRRDSVTVTSGGQTNVLTLAE